MSSRQVELSIDLSEFIINLLFDPFVLQIGLSIQIFGLYKTTIFVIRRLQ